jgi:hypothetical protein
MIAMALGRAQPGVHWAQAIAESAQNEKGRRAMDVKDILSQAEDAMNVKRVFGEPIEKDGVTIIPVAKVGGSEEGNKGFGAGFGLSATPAGVYVIRDGRVGWRPAVDVNRVIMGGQIVAIVFLLTIRAFIKARARGRFRRAITG